MLRRSIVRLLTLLAAAVCCAQPLDSVILIKGQGAAPQNVRVSALPNDGGDHLLVQWTPAPALGFELIAYEVLGATSVADSFYLLAELSPDSSQAIVTSVSGLRIEHGREFYVKVVARDSTIVAAIDSLPADSAAQRQIKLLRRYESAVVGPVVSRAAWFNWNRLNILLIVLLFYVAVMVMVRRAKAGAALHFRRIAGIDAIDEAIGRATELGKPVLYVPGTQNIENIQTIASIQLLTSVSTKAAEYDIPIIVPLNRAFMVTVAEEAVKQGFMNAGRPDAYMRDNIRYLSDEQFAFTSGTTGIMMREKTAAHFFLGAFFAESLILSETGFVSGAIQIAGTSNTHQLPFFVVACDYTLIGEEYFATSALVTRDVEMMGTLKATDYMKVFIIAAITVSMALELFGIQFLRSWFQVI